MKPTIVLLIVFILNSLSHVQAQVRLTSQIPSEITSGSRVAMTFTIEKKQLENFARFEQTLKPGFIAIENNSRGAEFKFEGNKVSLTWLRLPKDSVFSFSYFLEAADTLSGVFTFDGTFSYLYQNNRGVANMPTHQLSVKKVSNISDIPIAYIPNEVSTANISASQKLNLIDAQKGTYELEIILSSDREVNNLVLTENLTGVSKSTVKEDGGSKVNSKDNILNFAFSKLEAKKQVRIIVAFTAPNSQTVPTAIGNVAYTAEKSNVTIAVADKSLPIFVLSGSNQGIANTEKEDNESILSKYSNKITGKGVNILAGKTDKDDKTETKTETEIKSENNTTNTEKKNEMVDTMVVKERETSDKQVENKSTDIKKTDKKVSEGKDNKITINNNDKKSDNKVITKEAEVSVKYSVQIAAFSREIPATYFINLGVDDKVILEKHNGLYKYKLGNFSTYTDAKKFRDKVMLESNVKEAFIVAHNNNTRIKVADALKLSKRK